jgi:hypothetical protein
MKTPLRFSTGIDAQSLRPGGKRNEPEKYWTGGL